MSLDVYLEVDEPIHRQSSGIFIRENGSMREISRAEWDERNPGHEPTTCERAPETCCVYEANITHNLGNMAGDAGIYGYLWRPEEVGIETAGQLVEPLRAGLARLRGDPVTFRQHNPSNGWGDYDGLVRFVSAYLAACEEYPNARVRASR